jgi:hypothetical protein
MLLAQIALPALHGLAFAGEDQRAFGTEQCHSIASASASAQASASHDPSVCPICLASRQGWTGIIGAPLNGLARRVAAIASTDELRLAVAGAPELDSAPPRAPPSPALAFA